MSYSQPFYLIDKKSPLVAGYKELIEAAIAAEVRSYNIVVDHIMLKTTDIAEPERMLSALQHYPKYIGPMLNLVHFSFRKNEDSEAIVAEDMWKGYPVFQKYLFAMRDIPCLPFFVNDFDVRLYIIAGDYFAAKSRSVKMLGPESARAKVMATDGARMVLSKRIFNHCVKFLLYCHGSGFDPKEAILEFLADFAIPVHYPDVYKQYLKDVKNSISLASKPFEGKRTATA